MFFEEKNYAYFLQKYTQYVNSFLDTFAYCLLRNHFHLLIRTKSEEEIRVVAGTKKDDKTVSWHLSNAFASLFKSYAQAINKKYERTGGLFEEPFHRIEVTDESYFSWLVWYIHHNPQKHGFISDYKEYQHSSYQSHLLEKETKLQRNEVLEWFGGKSDYIKFHAIQNNEVGKLNMYFVEFD